MTSEELETIVCKHEMQRLWTIGRRIVYNISKQKHSLAVNTVAGQEKEFENVESASHSGCRREAEGEHSRAFARSIHPLNPQRST